MSTNNQSPPNGGNLGENGGLDEDLGTQRDGTSMASSATNQGDGNDGERATSESDPAASPRTDAN